MSPHWIDTMKHAYGFDSSSPGFREHYCTSVDDKDMCEMVAEGWFGGPHRVGEVGDGYGVYYLTDKAKEFLEELR